MAISRLSASRVTQGLPKFQSAWDQDAVAAGALVPIASSTLSVPGNFAFNNIPQTFQDLILVVTFVKNTGSFDAIFALNGDYTANSTGRIQMYSNSGSGHVGEFRTNDSTMYIPDGGAHSSGHFCTAIINLFDYKNSFRKTALSQVSATKASTYWTSISCATKTIGAVTNIDFAGNDGVFLPGSIATIYGVKAGL